MKVCVVGLGYIGLPTASILAHAGHDVTGVDVNESLLQKLRNGVIPIVNEEGLVELTLSALTSGRLRVGPHPQSADIFIISVPTPFQGHHHLPERSETDYKADLGYVESAVRSIAPYVKTGNLIILESTVPPGTTRKLLVQTLEEEGVDTTGLLFAHAPERVLPGNIVHELVNNDRIVGGLTPEATDVALRFYQSFVKGRVAVADATSAELVKLMENTFRDVNIALANEFALVSEQLGVDVWEAIGLANLHPRVNILRPGPGVGGHCIAVDPYFVVEAAPGITPLIQAARRVNRRMPLHVLGLFEKLKQDREVQKIVVLGASYKANVGDDRESPALEVALQLQSRGFEVVIHDPYVEKYNQPLNQMLVGADALLLLTDHRVYREIDPTVAAGLMAQRLLLDTRGHLNAADWRAAGFRVVQLGSGQTREVEALV